MIAMIQDEKTLRQIGPTEMAAYLRSHAWSQVEQIGNRATVWTTPAHEDGGYEILLPLDATINEYARRISEALHTLEIVEQRSQLDILRDITATTSDIIRVRLSHGLIEHGTLPLEHGVRMVHSTKDLALAAACAAVRPRALYSARKPQESLNFISGLRMGHTEEGSFVLSILSPVPPRAQSILFDDLQNEIWDEPFERRVLLTLSNALAAAGQSVVSAANSGNFQPFQDAVRYGVSANLCDALLELSMDNTAEEVSLQISWSPTRQVADKTPAHFRFRRDTFPVLREAAHILRESTPIEDFALFGTVTGLRREENTDKGRVTVSAWVENSWRKVRMELSGEDYRKAVKAHEDRELVEGTGELEKERRTYFLRNVRDFDLMEYPATDLPDENDPFSDE